MDFDICGLFPDLDGFEYNKEDTLNIASLQPETLDFVVYQLIFVCEAWGTIIDYDPLVEDAARQREEWLHEADGFPHHQAAYEEIFALCIRDLSLVDKKAAVAFIGKCRGDSSLEDAENKKQDNRLPQGGSRLETGDKVLGYIQIPNPLTFEDILILWVGKSVYEKMKNEGLEAYFLEYDAETLSIIRSVENQIDSAIRNGYVCLYAQRIAAGHDFYFKIPYDQGALFADTRADYGENLHKIYQFMKHYPDMPGFESEPLYFDGGEIFQQFPFLKLQASPSSETDSFSVSSSPTTNEASAQKWLVYSQQIFQEKGVCEEYQLAQIAMHKWRGRKQEKIFDMVYPKEQGIRPGTKKKRISSKKEKIIQLGDTAGLPLPPW